MSYGVGLRNGVAFALGTIPSLTSGGALRPSLLLDFLSGSLDPRITFSRGTQAMRYGSNGVLQYAPHNLLTYSQAFDNAAWTKSNSFVQTNLLLQSQDQSNASWTPINGTRTTSTVLGPDGITALSLWTSTLGGNRIQQFPNVTTGVTYTLSAYLAASTTGYGGLVAATSASAGAIFNLSGSGSVVSTTAGATATIALVSAGLYRCTMTFAATATATANVGFGISDGSTYSGSVYPSAASGSISGGFLQLVQGSVPGDYQATTSAALPVAYASWDGTLTAKKLCENTATAVHLTQNNQATVGNTQTLSVYAKAGERTQLYLQIGTNGGYFNLATGAVISGTNATITNIADGWYRCVLGGFPVATNANCFIGNAVGGANSYAGDGSSGIYIADAQLCQGYLPLQVTTTTSAAVYGPRFDYDPVTLTARGLLIEEQRTNLLLQSNDFQTSWTPTNITRTLNSTLSPEGVVNGVKIEATAAAATVLLQGSTIAATSASYSIYVKQGTGATTANKFVLRNQTTLTNIVDTSINYSTGVLTTTAGTATATSVGNGWWRLVLSASTGITSGDLLNAYVGFIGGVATAGDFLYAYGAQLEAGAFATSYIPTVASTATRNADSASITTLTPWFNAAAGTLYSQIDTVNSATAKLFSRIGPTVSGGIGPYAFSTNVVLDKNGTGTLITSAGTLVVSNTKTAWAYDGTNVAMSVNGGAVATALGALGTPADALYIGRESSALTNILNGHIQSLRYYPTRLPNASLQSITA